MSQQSPQAQTRHVAILGGGSFGTALANVIAENGHSVRVWVRDCQQAEEINTTHCNSRYLPGYKLHPGIQASDDMAAMLEHAEIVFFSIPSKAFREVVRQAKPHLNSRAILITTTKGIEKDSFKLMSEVLEEESGSDLIAVLSGPNLAKEIADRMLTGTVIASDNPELIENVQETLSCKYFRVYSNTDRYAVELGGALKNSYAIAAGMASAMGMGENTKSMLITRSLAEMSRFAAQLGGNPLTFLGLAGVGDLVTTCMSPLSRNFQIGFALGKGKSLEAAVDELGQVAEGINTIALVNAKAIELDIYMPLVAGLYEIIYEQQPLQEVITRLMLGEMNNDVDFVVN